MKCEYCNTELAQDSPAYSAIAAPGRGSLGLKSGGSPGKPGRIMANWEDGVFWYSKKCLECEEDKCWCQNCEKEICYTCERNVLIDNIIEHK